MIYLVLYPMWGIFSKNKSTVLHGKTVFLSFHNPTCPLVNLCPTAPATMASRPLILGEYLTEANQQISGCLGEVNTQNTNSQVFEEAPGTSCVFND